jgi:Zn-finger nucleic acid-binding protein
MSTREGIEIDYCQTCRGVWLDRGELDKIIDQSAKYFVVATPNQTNRTLSSAPNVNFDQNNDRGYHDNYNKHNPNNYNNQHYRKEKKRAGLETCSIFKIKVNPMDKNF